jgi:RNA polymerase sigma-70 factor, ECF subfamily
MPSNVVEIDEPETTIASLYELEAEQMLVASARSGDAQAFEMLVKRLEPRILALRYTSVREDAEDVVQQSLQKAFVYLHGFEGKSRFFTWLTRIAINEALMWMRRKRASPEVPIVEAVTADETDLPLDFPDSAASPEDNCLREEQERILAAAVKQLNPRTRKSNRAAGIGRAIHSGDHSNLGSVDRSSKSPPVPRAKEIAQEFEALRRISLGFPERRFTSRRPDEGRLGRTAYL